MADGSAGFGRRKQAATPGKTTSTRVDPIAEAMRDVAKADECMAQGAFIEALSLYESARLLDADNLDGYLGSIAVRLAQYQEDTTDKGLLRQALDDFELAAGRFQGRQKETDRLEEVFRYGPVSVVEQRTPGNYSNISLNSETEQVTSYKKRMPPKDAVIKSEVIEALTGLNERHALGLSDEDIYSRAGRWVEELGGAGKTTAGRRKALPSPADVTLRLPASIPDEKKYKSRQGVVEFLEKGWPAPFIKAGVLSRPDLRRLDPDAAMALENFLRNPRNSLPEHLHVPKKAELVDRQVSDLDRLREARRLVRAHDRRQATQR